MGLFDKFKKGLDKSSSGLSDGFKNSWFHMKKILIENLMEDLKNIRRKERLWENPTYLNKT